MKNLLLLFVLSAVAACAQQPQTVQAVLDRQLTGVERQFVGAAEAMPAEKFSFAPDPATGAFKDVRGFADQVKHVATANAVIAASLLGEKSPYTVEDVAKGPAGVKTREEILALLKSSFAAAHKAIATLEESKLAEIVAGPFGKTPRMALASLMLSHSMDHYGQMVVYLRMNNVVPPASRPRN